MSVFIPDCSCTFEDFRSLICYQAELVVIPDGTAPEDHFKVCRKIYESAMKHLAFKEYDSAFFFFYRCTFIIDKVNLRATCQGARELMKGCLDRLESLFRDKLQIFFNSMIKDVKEREAERKRFTAEQSLPDDSDLDVVLRQKRQEELLLNENRNVNNILQRIKNNSLSTPSPEVHTATEVDEEGPSQLDDTHLSFNKGICCPKKIEYPSSALYRYWKFPQQSSSSASVARRGMINLGNTCYLNSIAQVLSVTPLGKHFLFDEYTDNIVSPLKGGGRIVNSFSIIIRELKRTNTQLPVSPSLFKNAMGEIYKPFLGTSQQDGNEFLRVLLDGIHRDLNNRENIKQPCVDIDTLKGDDATIAEKYWSQYRERNDSVVVDICAFQERSSVECLSCHGLSRTFSPLMGIEVPIPLSKGFHSVEDSLAAYCKEEVLDKESLYTCPLCNNKVRASKQLLFFSLPKVLFITLKRFRHYGDLSDKILDPVFFQMKLDMSPFMCVDEKKSIFNLVGVVNHQGNIRGGHYTADCLSEDGVWYSCSDERVTEGSAPNFELAYILCYVRES